MYSKLIYSFILITFLNIGLFAQLSPRVSYATYIGGAGSDDAAYNLQIADNDDIYLCMAATNGCTTTEGVHQQNWGGGKKDVLIQKRSSDGTLIWSTYFGGNGDENPGEIRLLKSGKIALSGATTSKNKIAKNGDKQMYNGGTFDGFLAIFNTDGTLDWATYIGGPDVDEAFGITEDNDGNIYVCGNTNSTTGISTLGASQPNNKGGYDGFLSKYSEDGKLIWSTYVGGEKSESLYVLETDSKDNIWAGGTTFSVSGISTNGVFSVSYNGNGDGFLMRFDKDGKKQYGTYYGGIGSDEIYTIHIDKDDNIWFGGPTNSTTNIATPGAMIPNYQNSDDSYLVKFNNNLQRHWATYLGGSDSDYLFGIETDKEGNVIVALWTSSDDFIPLEQPFQDVYGGEADAVLTKIDASGSLIWSTYLGGSGGEYPWGIKVNSEGKLILFMTTGSKNMNTDNADDTTLNGEYDALLVILQEYDISKTKGQELPEISFKIAPNPVKDKFSIDIPDLDYYNVDIYDHLGKAIYEYTREGNSIDVRTMASGVYHIQLTDKVTGTVTSKTFLKI